jgi:hypothetical protein
MTSKPPVQKILQGILHTEWKQTEPQEDRKHQTIGEEKQAIRE